jgi:hypothetical protein
MSSTGVSLGLSVGMCVDGKSYPVSIHEGMSCAGMVAQGAVWDMTRGSGLPEVPCGMSANYVRANTDPKPWTIGMPIGSNLVGRLVVMYDPDDPTKPIICGPIHSP